MNPSTRTPFGLAPFRTGLSGPVSALILAWLVINAHASAPAEPIRILPQEAYIWQRAWNEPVRHAVADHGASFSRLVVLSTEIAWKDKRARPVRVAIDYASLAKTSRPIGLALRIGPYPGPFSQNDTVAKSLGDIAVSILSEARSNQVQVSELQLDFDCAESGLAGYRLWVQAIRQRVAPMPVIITVLPTWLKQPAFKTLALEAGSYVLQVHSLEKPKDFQAHFTLCDPEAAQRAVKRAGQVGIPFRVALPTYGYDLAFDRSGRFAGLSAEGPAKSWPEGVRLRRVRADPIELAKLVQAWATNRPPSMRGIIWYRFPTAEDTLNWRWPTLRAMLALRSPQESLRAESRRVEPGLVEISLANDGELDISSRLAIEVRWSRDGGIRLVAADGLRGFFVVEQGKSTVQFETQSQPCLLPAGETRVIGWLRFSEDREVQVEYKKF